jgi:hypothetical protein
MDSRYGFCGMCGSKLPKPRLPFEKKADETAPTERREQTRPVSGPSFLGLADESTSSGAYLLEEDDGGSSWRTRLLIATIFLGSLGFAGWHWGAGLKGWAAHLTQKPVSAQARADQTTYQVAPITTSGSEVAGSLPTAQTITAAQTPTSAAPSPPVENSAAAQKNIPAEIPRQPNAIPPQAARAAPVRSAASAKKDESQPQNPPSVENSTKEPSQLDSETQESASDAKGEALEAEGEKYLYGAGVPANCALAQKSLLTAAEHANSKAQSVLGTMYATGHCAPRDLPLAYFWFAMAMRQAPDDARAEHDLMVVWNQMSADERQLAIHHGQ